MLADPAVEWPGPVRGQVPFMGEGARRKNNGGSRDPDGQGRLTGSDLTPAGEESAALLWRRRTLVLCERFRHEADRALAYNEGKAVMPNLDRITRDPAVMGGKPCLRGMRVTVGTIVGLVAAGHSRGDILAAYPYLESEDIRQALAYAAWRVEEIELPLPTQ